MRSIAEKFEQDIVVESAGTEGYHVGESPDSRMQQAALARGFSMRSRGRQVTARDLAPGCYDLVIAMDHANIRRLRSIATGNTSHIRLFSEFLADTPHRNWTDEVPDPYYGGADGFEQVLDMLEAGCPELLNYLTNDSFT